MKKIYISSSQIYVNDFLTFQLKGELAEFGYEIINKDSFDFIKGDDIRQNIEYFINQADIVIGILKDFNPNVLFEMGYATAKNKKILIITDNEFELPFDLRKYNIIKFTNDYRHSIHQIINYIEKTEIEKVEEISKPRSFKEFVVLMKEYPNFLDSISPIDFEEIIYMYFKEKGFDCKSSSYPNDYGYDLELNNYKDFGKTLVEIKKYNINNKVSITIIQQLLGAMSISEANHGIIVATSGFTASARDFVESINNKVELWTLNELIEKGYA